MAKVLDHFILLQYRLVLFVFICLGATGSAQNPLQHGVQIEQLFSQYNTRTPGMAVGVVQNGKLIYSNGYGMANLEYGIPITPKTIFHVASVSKQFTTFAIYLLEDQGKIHLDDDIRMYLPELPVYEEKISIAQLCSHTSGLKDQWSLLTLAGWRMDDVITTEQVFKLLCRQQTLNFKPGTAFRYSNSGFTLLAMIVERASGLSFSDFTQQYIFKPLGMGNTQFYDDHQKIVPNRAYSYAPTSTGYEKMKLNYANVGATSLFTTVEDLSKWVNNFDQPVVGDLNLIKRYNEISSLSTGNPAILTVLDGDTIYHAKGQFFRRYRGVGLFNHTGGDAGFRSYLARFPSEELSVILLSNDQQFNRLENGLAIAELYLADVLEPKTLTENNQSDAGKTRFTPDNNLDQYIGEYCSEDLATCYEVKSNDSDLILSHSRLSDATFTPVGPDRFEGQIWFDVQMQFSRNENGQISGLLLSNFGADHMIFEKTD